MMKSLEERCCIALLGYFFLGLGLVDGLTSLGGIDFYGLFGLQLSETADSYAPIFAGLLGIIFLALGSDRRFASQIADSMPAGEQLVFCRRVRVKNGGLFGGFSSGFLILSDKRLGYLGDLPEAYSALLEQDDDLGDINWDLAEVRRVTLTC